MGMSLQNFLSVLSFWVILITVTEPALVAQVRTLPPPTSTPLAPESLELKELKPVSWSSSIPRLSRALIKWLQAIP